MIQSFLIDWDELEIKEFMVNGELSCYAAQSLRGKKRERKRSPPIPVVLSWT